MADLAKSIVVFLVRLVRKYAKKSSNRNPTARISGLFVAVDKSSSDSAIRQRGADNAVRSVQRDESANQGALRGVASDRSGRGGSDSHDYSDRKESAKGCVQCERTIDSLAKVRVLLSIAIEQLQSLQPHDH